jgi:hypothetical protein
MKTKHILFLLLLSCSTLCFSQSGTIKVARPFTETGTVVKPEEPVKKVQKQKKYMWVKKFPFIVKYRRSSCTNVRFL